VSAGDSTVLITGESGTGKELVARAIHSTSERSAGPFVAINCAAMPQSLLESELFGHEKGAFTDAKWSRDGLFVQANGGTLFLDEIGEMPLPTQPTLLRALEERTLRPIGGRSEVPFDTRIIAATNRDLESDVEEGRFREDLFYRVNVVPIHVPPLRSRGNDILLLAQHFLEQRRESTGKQVVGFAKASTRRRVGAAGVFPLRFRGQPAAGPLAIGLRLVPAHTHDGVVGQPFVVSRVSPQTRRGLTGQVLDHLENN